jgi:[ribosomal protein S5]-alanine N-acetyltransferase
MTDRILETERLILRPYAEGDIAELIPLIGAREVAATTLRIPHPYTEQDAREFIAATRQGGLLRRTIRTRADGKLIGGIGLNLEEQDQRAELGYWIGVPYWGHGYATEAGHETLRFGFEELRLNRIFAQHFGNNPASGRVLVKLGMRYEGCQRQHLRKWGEFVDLELFGIMRQEWLQVNSRKSGQTAYDIS